MSATSDLIRKLGAAGASVEMIALTVEAMETARDDVKAKGRERQRRWRERHITSRNVTQRHGVSPALGKEIPPGPPKENSTHLLTPISDANASSPRQVGAAFDRFWLAYPRKIGKGAARKSFERALKRIGEPDPASQILGALETAKRAWAKRDEPDFIPHPATWLNQDRWEDESEGGSVIAFTPPSLTPQQQADLERIHADRRPRASEAGPRPVNALGALAGGG